jgi:acetyl-CoA acetyltransferase
MRDVTVSGVGMSTFGRHIGRTVKSLVAEATREALSDAGRPSVQVVYYANAAGGLLQGQESVRGQHAVRGTGLEGVPLVNVENAGASGSTALHQAWLAVASGQVDVALAVGAEKLNVNNRSQAFAAMTGALDQDRLDDVYAELGTVGSGSVFMDIYARFAAWYLGRTRASVEDFAAVSVKNHEHGLANPKAQYGGRLTVAEVLAARPVSGPLTAPMCAPMSDGAAAVVVTTPQIATRQGADPVRLLATAVGAARPGEYGVVVPATARRVYETAGVGPSDVDVVECHDAAAPAELIIMEELGLCEPGEAPALLRAGETWIGGRLPVNPSGGLQSRGHPLGATGLAQVVELAEQLRGRAGERQVPGARLALAENAGGYVGPDAAVATVTILGR